MSKLIVATPNEEMFAQATEVIDGAALNAKVLLVSSQNVLDIVQAERDMGAAVVVARGNHAHLIKTYTDMPLIEIVISGQELALLIEQAVALAEKERPRIALVGFRYMFSDPEPFARILNADVSIYYARATEAIPETVERARADGIDCVIGGEIALLHAAEVGLKGVFLGSSKASLITAISLATRVLHGIEQEQRRSLEFMSLLDYSFDVILKLDAGGVVQAANYMAEKTFHRRATELKGMRATDLLEMPEDSPLARALAQHQNAYSIVVRSKRDAFVANVASLVVDGLAEGYILSMQAFNRIDELEERVRTDRVNRAHTAVATFGNVRTESPRMQEACEEAAQYAQYDLPVLITGVFGTDKAEMAQCIHNASMRRRQPFVAVNLTGLNADMQRLQFAGARGERELRSVFEMAHGGTLFIEHVDLLAAEVQWQLLNVLCDGFLPRSADRPLLPVNVRVLCATDRDLHALVRAGGFLEPLYYRLSQLEVRVPMLRERAEDIPLLMTLYMERYAEKYRKYVAVAPEAQALIHAQAWEGDILQLAMFLEKLVILARDKHIDRAFVQKHLPHRGSEPGVGPEREMPGIPPVYYSREEAEIVDMLRKHKGSRTATAQALGISKTTLWRKMKKHGIALAYAKETET